MADWKYHQDWGNFVAGDYDSGTGFMHKTTLTVPAGKWWYIQSCRIDCHNKFRGEVYIALFKEIAEVDTYITIGQIPVAAFSEACCLRHPIWAAPGWAVQIGIRNAEVGDNYHFDISYFECDNFLWPHLPGLVG